MKRILVTIVGQGSITHIIRSGILEGMRAFCEPVIGILWNEESLVDELRSKGYEVHIIPPYAANGEYNKLRTKINMWYIRKVLKTPSTRIQHNYFQQYTTAKKNLKRKVRWRLEILRQTFIPGYVNRLIAAEKAMIQKQSFYPVYKEWLEAIHIDGLYTVSPFLQQIELLGRLAKESGVPIISSIHSFDNITVRGWPAIFFDHYIVWNKYNKAELRRINFAFTGEDITIAGAPQFDFHFNPSFGQRKEEWLQRNGIPAGKKIILYGGGPGALFPNEPQYLKHLVDAFASGLIKEEALIFFRCHPLDKMDRWKAFVGDSPHIIYDSSPNGKKNLDYTNVTVDDIDKLVSTLKYTDVHINLCSTMTVDGSVFSKPQIGPAYDDLNKLNEHLLRNLYYQEHFTPIMEAQVVQLASSKEQLVQLVNQALEHPELYNRHCKRCVDEIITYTDGHSANRVVEVLKRFFS